MSAGRNIELVGQVVSCEMAFVRAERVRMDWSGDGGFLLATHI